MPPLLSLLLVFVLSHAAPAGPALDLVALDADLNALTRIADGYPPRIETPEERLRAEALFRSLESRLVSALRQSPSDFALSLRAGALYRMGHNLDVKGAYPAAELHLKSAIALRPSEPLPHFLLGQHYVASFRPAEGEPELHLAMANADHVLCPAIYYQLAFAAYYLKRYGDVVYYATEYLRTNPSSRGAAFIKERAEAALRGEFEVKIIPVEMDGPPDGKLVTDR